MEASCFCWFSCTNHCVKISSHKSKALHPPSVRKNGTELPCQDAWGKLFDFFGVRITMMLGVVGYVAAAVGCIHTNILSILISFIEIVIRLWILLIEKNSGEFINDRVLHFLFVLLCFGKKIGSATQTIMELEKLLFHHPQCSYSRCI